VRSSQQRGEQAPLDRAILVPVGLGPCEETVAGPEQEGGKEARRSEPTDGLRDVRSLGGREEKRCQSLRSSKKDR
jgi:hypothetical protein